MEKAGVSPRIGKRELQQHQRRSRTINSLDDSATEKRKQRSMRAGDSLKVCMYVCLDSVCTCARMPSRNVTRLRECFELWGTPHHQQALIDLT